jgi:hypothetical protein
MLDTLKAEGDPRALGRGAIFDTYEYVKQSPKDYATWLKTRDAELTSEAERRASEFKIQEKQRKKLP